MKTVYITRVMSRSFLMDFKAGIQNLLGRRLSGYEAMVDKGMAEIQAEVKKKKLQMSWYRYEITQLTNGAISITFYGDSK